MGLAWTIGLPQHPDKYRPSVRSSQIDQEPHGRWKAGRVKMLPQRRGTPRSSLLHPPTAQGPPAGSLVPSRGYGRNRLSLFLSHQVLVPFGTRVRRRSRRLVASVPAVDPH
jgi:hypothetical protein